MLLEALPSWLLQGILVGVALSAGVAGLFYVIVRQFPGREHQQETGDPGDDRRRTEIREYLDAIDEQYAEAHSIDGQDVAFYLPKRDIAITFDARAYYRIARSDTEAVLVEHELPGIALGNRLPFETPSADPASDTELEPEQAAYAALGLPTGASVDEVKRAYRQRVKEVHPDHGGDEDDFKRLREAYTTAKQHAS